MPIYEYRRKDGSTFEVMQKLSDDPLTVDPETGEPVKRVYTAPAIHFKGSGFHNTDYASSRRPKAGAADSAVAESSDGAGGSASESKAAVSGASSDGGSASPATKSAAAAGSAD